MPIGRMQLPRELRSSGGIMSIGDQGGMKNYLGNQPMVTAPKFWRSGPESPPTELAYITDAEKDMIMRADLHGSLSQGPNEGPSGIMSLDSQGDYTRDRSQDKERSQMDRGDSERAVRNEARLKEILTGQVDTGQTSAYRGPTGDDLVQLDSGDYVAKKDLKDVSSVGGVNKSVFNRGFVTPTQKFLYNVFPNNPKNEKAYIRYLQSQGVTIPPNLLKAIEEEDKKLSFEDFQELVAFEPKGITDIETLRGIFTDPTRGPFDKILAKPQTFSEFMLTQRNNPGLFVSGDLGNFMDLPKPKDLVNPKTGELYTNQEWNALKQDIGEDRGLLGGGRENNEPQDPCKGPTHQHIVM